MHPLTADSGPRNSLWTPNSLCFLIQLRLPFSSRSGFIRVTMEATEIEQHGAAFSNLEHFMVGNVAWHIMVQM